MPGTKGKEHFVVNNFEGTYAGTRSLGQALTYSDNSVFAAAGIHYGTKKIARLAPAHGHPHAGLTQPGDDARRTEGGRQPARHGARLRDVRDRRRRISGTLGANDDGPVGIDWVKRIKDDKMVKDEQDEVDRAS